MSERLAVPVTETTDLRTLLTGSGRKGGAGSSRQSKRAEAVAAAIAEATKAARARGEEVAEPTGVAEGAGGGEAGGEGQGGVEGEGNQVPPQEQPQVRGRGGVGVMHSDDYGTVFDRLG